MALIAYRGWFHVGVIYRGKPFSDFLISLRILLMCVLLHLLFLLFFVLFRIKKYINKFNKSLKLFTLRVYIHLIFIFII